MMTHEEVMALLETLGNDVLISDYGDMIRVTVEDFKDFDDDWCEVILDYNEEAVNRVLKTLEAHCTEVINNFYTDYHFDDFWVRVGYTSYDI